MQSGKSAFWCVCGNTELKIAVVGGTTLARCPACGLTKPLNECAHDRRWATVPAGLDGRHDRESPSVSSATDGSPHE
jgi:hypothetical protein